MPIASQEAKEIARKKREHDAEERRKDHAEKELKATDIGQAMLKAGGKIIPKKGGKAKDAANNTLAPAVDTVNGASSSSVGVSPVGTDDGAASSSHAKEGKGTTPISAEVERLAFGDDDDDEEMLEA